MFVLDTDHITILQRQTQPELARLLPRLGQHPQAAFYWTVISLHEQSLGAHTFVNRARTPAGVVSGYELFRQLLLYYCAAQVLPFDQAASAVFGLLQPQRIRIGTMDLRIASIALSRNFTVLTRNVGDFRQVPNLNVEDWTT
jgi:tRNA(fMet)-specific endonuclease VapC